MDAGGGSRTDELGGWWKGEVAVGARAAAAGVGGMRDIVSWIEYLVVTPKYVI